MNKYNLIFSVLLLCAGQARAAQTGAQFLSIDTDARLSGMSSAGASSVYGISSIGYNPAGLTAMTGPELAFSHSKWLMDANHDFIGFGLPVKRIALGLGIIRLSNGTMESRADDGSSGGGYSAYDQAVSLGFGFRNVGGAVKYIQSSIAGIRAEAFAVDLGVKHRFSRLPVTFGLGVQNLGGGIKYLSQRDNLPLSVNVGFSVMAMPGMGLVLDVKRFIYDKRSVLSVGTEYAMFTGAGMGMALRGGYGLTGLTRSNDKSGLSVGAGLMALGGQLDYAVSPESGLGSIQRITLKKKF